MAKKLFTMAILCIFISSSLITTSTLGIKVNKSNDTLISENGDGETEYWGLFIAPTDFGTGDDSFIFDVVILKQILLRNGWQENHINLITGDIVKDDVYQGFSWLKENADNDDIILVYMSDHGGPGKFYLKEDLYIDYKDIDEKLDLISYKGVAIIVDACHSGSAIPAISQKNRVVISSCRASEESGFYHLITGLTIVSDIAGNRDGNVSIEECFRYLINYCYVLPNTNPVINDRYPGELVLTSYDKDQYSAFSPINLNCENSEIIYNTHRKEIQSRQSFISHGTTLRGVLIQVGYGLNDNNILNFSLQDTSGVVLFEKDIMANDLFPESSCGSSYQYWILIETSDIPLNKDEEYYLVFKSKIIDDHSVWYIRGNNKNIYTEGMYEVSYDDGITWEEDINQDIDDISFVLFGEGDKINNKNNLQILFDRIVFRIQNIISNLKNILYL